MLSNKNAIKSDFFHNLSISKHVKCCQYNLSQNGAKIIKITFASKGKRCLYTNPTLGRRNKSLYHYKGSRSQRQNESAEMLKKQ